MAGTQLFKAKVNYFTLVHDEFEISRAECGWMVASRQALLGKGGWKQELTEQLTPDWAPIALQIRGDKGSAMIDCDQNAIHVIEESERGVVNQRWTSPRDRTLIFVELALHQVMYVGRRYNFEANIRTRLRIPPHGRWDVTRGPDLLRAGRTVRTLNVVQRFGQSVDFVTLLVNDEGQVIEYRSRNTGIRTYLAEEGEHCAEL